PTDGFMGRLLGAIKGTSQFRLHIMASYSSTRPPSRAASLPPSISGSDVHLRSLTNRCQPR
ncbi:MAG: hypothetical protein KC587_18825, partial [Nitrospira sp.]|nr:hypothetical protein [Nitrospira sp.]